jgi:alkylation response protein AidB-like acyl-CoA dehydrogenase
VTDLTPPPSLLDAARNLAPLVRECADETDANRELPRRLFEALADAGLFLMCVPREIGGARSTFRPMCA